MTATANYAYTLLLQNRVDEATPLVETAFSKDPNDYRSLVLKGIVALSNGSTNLARTFFEKVLETDSENVQALSRLAVICHESGEVAEGNKYLDTAELQLHSTSECLRGLCYAYAELGLQSRQLDCLLKWTLNDPGAAAPWIALAIEYDKMGNKREALRSWKKMLELRGYVRINCKKCGNSARHDLEPHDNFDPYEEVQCAKCGTSIQMPKGFLTF